MKIKTILFLVFFSIICFDSYSQNKKQEDDLLTVEEQSREKYINNISIQESQVINGANNSIINVDGNNNSGIINQIHNGGIDPNIANLNQLGNGNRAEINQDGNGNTTVLTQDGNNNQFRGNITGEDNNSNIIQDGNNNIIDHAINGNSMDIDLIQNGNNNRITHSDFGTQDGAPQVIQNGNNMNITIENK